MTRWSVVAIAYSLLAAVSAWLSEYWQNRSVFAFNDPWLKLDSLSAHCFSATLGLCVGVMSVFGTKLLVRRFEFAARLHADLRPLALSLSSPMVAVLAASSAIGEEFAFRGLLLPWIGQVPQALLFGLLHQTSGSSRWVWMAWATLGGLVLGAMYQLSGSLVGPIVAHAVINGLTLQFLKQYDPCSGKRPLGGLLGQRS